MSYRLSAPLCLAGETRPIEPALVERILTANPDKNALQKDPGYEQAYRRVKQVSPTLLSASIVRFLLARDTETDLKLARELTDRMLGDREVQLLLLQRGAEPDDRRQHHHRGYCRRHRQ